MSSIEQVLNKVGKHVEEVLKSVKGDKVVKEVRHMYEDEYAVYVEVTKEDGTLMRTFIRTDSNVCREIDEGFSKHLDVYVAGTRHGKAVVEQARKRREEKRKQEGVVE